MKKVIISAVALMVSAAAFAQTNNLKSSLKFQRYISKNISSYTSYAADGVQGTVRLQVIFANDGIGEVNVLTGISQELDQQVVALVRRTPSRIVQKMIEDKQTSVILPVKFVASEN